MAESEEGEVKPRSSGGNPLTRKMGPLPMWGWLAIGLVLALVYRFISKSKTSSTTTGAGSTTGATSVNTPGGVDASLVPQFVNQTYTDVTPPQSPTINVTIPPTPPPGNVATTPPSSGAPGSSATQPPIMNGKYVVKAGQSLAQVAALYGISRVDLAHANGLGTGAGLRTGQVLKVPSPAPGGKPGPAQ
jgi:LysM repeat protein